ncbi:unnamed protein product [Brassica rapa]|uniref:Uncharacterized protein n=1 Tax=Brassica campestris TaxID=3711 RepID=A0A8D9M0G9_BRACM|nr:unnamed protein product [Brassica rapa]
MRTFLRLQLSRSIHFQNVAVEATEKELRQSVHLAGDVTLASVRIKNIVRFTILRNINDNHLPAPISTHVIWLFSGPKNESSHTRSVEKVVLTRVS